MKGKLHLRREAPLEIEVARVAFLLPCQKFRVSYSATENRDLPLMDEFALRLIKTAERLSPTEIGQFFGLSSRETVELLAELREAEMIAQSADLVALSHDGDQLFKHGSQDEPRLMDVTECNSTVSIDLVSFNLVEGDPRLKPFVARTLEEMEINVEKVANGAERAGESFRSNFDEYVVRFGGQKQRDRRGSLYALTSVEPRSRFDGELVISIKFKADETGRLEPDFSQLMSLGRPNSRDALQAAVYRKLFRGMRVDDAWNALQILFRFDEGLLSKWAIGEKLDISVWARYAINTGSKRSQNGGAITPIVGATSSEAVAQLLRNHCASASSDSTAPLIWIKPEAPYWGAGTDYFQLVKDLTSGPPGSAGSTCESALLGSLGHAKEANHLNKAYRSLFKFGIFSKTRVFPPGLELVLKPGEWVLALAHVAMEGDVRIPLAIGYFSDDPAIADGFGETIRSEFTLIDDLQVIWPETESVSSGRNIINRLWSKAEAEKI